MAKKNISSKDGRITISYADITHVCMTGSIHALLQYLILFDYDIVAHHTCYFLGYAVNDEISGRLPAVHFSTKQTGTVWTPSRWIDKLRIRLSRNIKYPFLKTAQIFAMDGGFVPPLIGHNDYALLSDGPLSMSQNMQVTSAEYQRQIQKKHTLQGQLEELLYGPVAVFGWGNNKQCKAFYLTEENQSAVFGEKPVYVQSLQQMWQNASDKSKDFVKYVFGIDEGDMQILNNRKYIYLTQPIVKDRILAENEYVGILRSILSHYDQSQVLMKLHPRDNFDYKKYFPEVGIYDKKVNMQLLVMLGASFQRAITICSSSANSFPETVELDWYGVDIHPKLKAFFGEMVPPNRKYNQISL